MLHIDHAFRAQGRQVSAADVCVQRVERLSKDGYIGRAVRDSCGGAIRWKMMPEHREWRFVSDCKAARWVPEATCHPVGRFGMIAARRAV
jgi:hypothetical protein